MRAFGVMQGRLLPKYQGRYQAFPVGNWQKEFSLASKLGLECIEFIVDSLDNPLLSDQGVDEIKNLVRQTGVGVFTICADYFMDHPLFSLDEHIRQKNVEILEILIRNGNAIGVRDIVIPFVDQSSLKNDPARIQSMKQVLEEVLPLAESLNVHLALETDLAPQSFLNVLKLFSSSAVTVNYDSGNSAYLGYDVCQEMQAYGSYITTVHIKDRKKGMGSVILGQGDADINLTLAKLKECDFQGCIVLQAYRDDEGLAIFKQQLEWFKPIMNKYYSISSSKG